MTSSKVNATSGVVSFVGSELLTPLVSDDAGPLVSAVGVEVLEVFDVVVGLDVVVVVFDVVGAGGTAAEVVVLFEVELDVELDVELEVDGTEVVSEVGPVVLMGSGPAASLHAMLSAAAHRVEMSGPRNEDTLRMGYVR